MIVRILGPERMYKYVHITKLLLEMLSKLEAFANAVSTKIDSY